jgi:putative phage-type endonuclease
MMDILLLDKIINTYWKDGEKMIHEHANAFDSKFIDDRISEIKCFVNQLAILSKITVIEQRSDEWYKIRNTLITASDMGQALGVGKFGNVKDFYIKKCNYEPDTFGTGYMAPLEWGNKYEQVATNIYEIRQCTKVNPFGLIKHPNIDFFGASPDGITDCGIMLEIKCPFKRKIDGKIVDQYYYQMQGQLAVAELNECDFLECEFNEYIDEYDFWEDWDSSECLSENKMEKGIIVHLINHPTEKYLYSNIFTHRNEKSSWLSKTLLLYKDYEYYIDYYKLEKYNLQKVYRDIAFFEEKIKDLKNVWANIIKFRNDKVAYDEAVKKRIVIKRPIKCLFVKDPESNI